MFPRFRLDDLRSLRDTEDAPSRLVVGFFLRSGGPLLVIAVLLSSCAAPRINQFKKFSRAGAAYADMTKGLTKAAGEASIEADSDVLIRSRQCLATDKRRTTIIQHNCALKERLSLLDDLYHHAILLKVYFDQLDALADPNIKGKVGSSVEGIFREMAELNKRINKGIGTENNNVEVSKGIAPVSKIMVANFQKKELQRELNKRVETLKRELELQRAAMEFISDEWEADLQIQQNALEKKVIDQFKGPDSLPPTWKEDRKDVLKSSLMISILDETAKAARNLEQAFDTLLRGRETNIDALVQDLDELVEFFEAITKNKER